MTDRNHWLTKLIGLIAMLALGAYGFAYLNGEAIKAGFEKRLERIEAKQDQLLDLFYGPRPGRR